MSGKRATHRDGYDAPAASIPAPCLAPYMEQPQRGRASHTRAAASSPSSLPVLTEYLSNPDPEPRRSVRATKGQHTKSFEQLENGPEPVAPVATTAKQRRGRKKKPTEKEEEEEEEEVIRCVCGATSQENEDANEPWIACDTCGAWQHNVCMGMSVFTEDLPKNYYCEQCRPENHKEMLEAMAKGEKPWETRRQEYEDEKKKKKGGKKGKGKRVSDPKDRSSPGAANTKPKASPTPDVKKEEVVPETGPKGKRKSRDHSQGPQSKLRKVSETQAAPATPKYEPPNDLPDSISKLDDTRRPAALGLQKSLDSALDAAEKRGLYTVPAGTKKKALTERFAIEVERAFHDAHPNRPAQQLRALIFNLKNNVELAARVFNRALIPPRLVLMSSDEMATKELQQQNAEMKAQADKQSILITEEGPRVRRTHKGEEIVEGDTLATAPDEVPSVLRRQSVREAEAADADGIPSGGQVELPANVGSASGPLRVDTKGSQHSPKHPDFDINKVFSSVRSPSLSHPRRPSVQVPLNGPGVDPEVDRMLQDGDNESPPYSPTENLDPDVVWQGGLMMTNVADIPTVAKYVGGADLSKARGIAWKDLIPPILTVAGRIPEEKAVPYLCGLRYNNQIDVVITSLAPAYPNDPAAKKQFLAVIDYFKSKKRYGVVGERKLGNVRDTYLVPVAEGDSPIPEPMQNIGDHLIPSNRTEPMLLMVFVVRDEKQSQIPPDQQISEMQQSGTPSAQPGSTPSTRGPSVSAPAWSPATPQAPFAGAGFQPQSQTPIPPPVIPGQTPVPVPQRPTPTSATPTPAPAADPNAAALRAAQLEGEMKARQVLGPLFSSATVTFLLPHAARMKEGEWNAVKRCLEKDPRARDDLPLLSRLLTEEGNNARQNGQAGPQGEQAKTATASPGVVQTTLAAATAGMPNPGPGGPGKA